MRKNERKDKKKAEELAKTQRSTIVNEEGTYGGVAEGKKTDDQVLKHM